MKTDELAADVAEHGWMVVHVAVEDGPEFAYSVGLHRSFGHPEIIVVGLDEETMHDLINDVGEAISEGRKFREGSISSTFVEEFDVIFRLVPRPHHAAYLPWAHALYAGEAFDALQLVYPDHKRRWPWNTAVAPAFRSEQPVLADVAPDVEPDR